MHITCQDCETIFNLDDRLLKPGGSKVRCSQCGKIFVAYPAAAMPEPSPVTEPPQSAAPTQTHAIDKEKVTAAASDEPGVVMEQELEGIDLAELDAILENEPRFEDSGIQARGDKAALPNAMRDDSSDDLLSGEDLIKDGEDIDLDLDFDMDLEPGAGDDGAQAAETDDLLVDLDLDMDFELDDGLDLDEPAVEPPHPETAEQEQAEEIKEPVEVKKEDLAEEDLELALDDFDLDNVESEPEFHASESPSKDSVGETDTQEPDLSLDDLDLDLEAPVQEEKTVPAEASADLAFDDLDLEPGVEQVDQGEDEELSLAFDDLDENSGAEAPVADESDKADIDALDLDDLDLDEILNGADADTSQSEEVQEEELSLLEDEEGQDEKASTRDASEEDELDLQLDDLDLGDEGDTLAESLPEEASDDEALEEEIGLEPELSLEDQAAGELSDELDLSDLGGLLEESGEAISPTEEDAPDLELSLDDEPSAEQEGPSGEIELEDLEFELDAEVEDKPIAKTKEPEPVVESEKDDDELDLSDIEQMLEGDTILEPSSDSVEAASVEEPESLGAGLGDELDLGEIEASIDFSGEEKEEKAQGDDELDLDLDLPSEDTSAEASEAIADLEELDLDLELEEGPEDSGAGEEALELELEDTGDELELELEMDDKTPQEEEALDMSDLGDLVLEEKGGVKSETIDTGDIELEFEVQEDVPVEDYDPTTSQTFATGALPVEETMTAQPVPSKAKPKARPRKKKKGTSKLLIFVLLLVMIGAGGWYAYDPYIKDFLEQKNIQIPYLDQFLNPKPKDPAGILNLSVLDINSKFIESDKNGRLFVISGKVRNGYGHKRGNILLNGKLFSKGKVLVKSEQVYAGLTIPDQDLKTTPIAEIQLGLKKMPEPQDADTSVHPGQTLPFMVVFSDLPGDLDEFVVEKVSSQKVP